MARPLASRAAQAIVIGSRSLFIVPFRGALNNNALKHAGSADGVMPITGDFVHLVESYDQKKGGPEGPPHRCYEKGDFT
jgi:hypothetical protein